MQPDGGPSRAQALPRTRVRACGSEGPRPLQGWAHELGVVFGGYGLGSGRVGAASLRGRQPRELLERALLPTRDEGEQHLAWLGPDDLWGVHRPPRDEDECPWRRGDDSLPDEELELPRQYIEPLVTAVVNMAGCAEPRGTRRLHEADRAPGLLAARLHGEAIRI